MHLSSGPRCWSGVGALLGLPALAVGADPSAFADWALRPAQGLSGPPWSWWTCAWLHLNERHLTLNLAALALIVLLGWLTRVSRGAALAWWLAWPLSHLALLADPRLTRYVGLSGVLHAGVAVLAIHLLCDPWIGGERRRLSSRLSSRFAGGALLAGLLGKCALENPHLQPLVHRPDLAIDVAPLSHLAGTLVGTALALALARCGHRTQSRG